VTYIDNTTETFYTNYIPTETEEKKVKKHKNFTCILIFILLMFMGVGIIFLLKYIGSLVTDYILLPIFYYLP
ncbi:MAG: hypothetical protein K2H28_10995, partial [Ruminococcus sp.]|nr:hypothetical protein [Ruminococcus sp.]